MARLNIPTKATNDEFSATELNSIVTAIQNLQGEKGYGTYFDTSKTALAPQIITSGGFVAIENNKGNVIEGNLPYGVTTLYNGTKITPPVANAQFQAYVSFFAKTSNKDTFFDFGIDIGGTSGVIFKTVDRFIKGDNVYEKYTIPVNGYMGDAFLANGGIPKIEVNTGTVSIYDATFFVGIVSQPQ